MEVNDYESDFRFGKWLRNRRVECSLTLEQAASKSGMSFERIKSLELGFAEKSVTKKELESLSKIYGLQLNDLVEKAIHTP